MGPRPRSCSWSQFLSPKLPFLALRALGGEEGHPVIIDKETEAGEVGASLIQLGRKRGPGQISGMPLLETPEFIAHSLNWTWEPRCPGEGRWSQQY